ncbi:cysteine-rich venom protein TEL1-like [Polypterus senegalus]|uniref:cysteine-rich venom protein TEL1-like n=1 Tax=Polypterus senegalus TaxID=55291 RepID=UPI001966C2A1|nr:cysteine-rich venom protein TEL1-like [Polypterus senegalus]
MISIISLTGIITTLLQISTARDDLSKILTTDPNVQKTIVDKHNAVRGSVHPTAANMLKMKWNTEAAANAERWARTCSMNHSPSEQRRISKDSCGENLYMSSNERPWESAIQGWEDEKKDYVFGEPPKTGKVVGHYTQLVWASSNQVGCAVAHCPSSQFKYFYVCQYCPPGNFIKSNPYTLGASCSSCPKSCEKNLCTHL